jgi:CBS domain-containing protein
MTADPIVVSAQTTVDAARILMVQHDIHHLPVAEGERPVGMIGMRDVVRAEPVPMKLGLGL